KRVFYSHQLHYTTPINIPLTNSIFDSKKEKENIVPIITRFLLNLPSCGIKIKKMAKIKQQDALEYHATGKPGKIEVIPTKPYSTQRDLTLAYSPGVAEPCLKIAENKEDVYKYTIKSNLVAVITNGTAVL